MTLAGCESLRLSREGYAESPYSAKALYRVNQWRDQHSEGILSAFAIRVACQLVYPLIAIATVIELLIRKILVLKLYKSKSCDVFSALRLEMMTADTLKCALFDTTMNLLVKKLAPETFNYLKKSDPKTFLWERTVEHDRIKLLSHWLEITGDIALSGNQIPLEGARGLRNCMLPSVAHSFQAFMQCPGSSKLSLSKESAKTIQDALLFASTDNPQEMLEKIRSGISCIIQTGWKNHAICLAFCGNYMAIGDGMKKDQFSQFFSGQPSDLQVFKIDRHLMTESHIHNMIFNSVLEIKKGLHYFYKTLPASLSQTGKPVQDALCIQFRNCESQTVGNCPLYSILAVIPFLWTMAQNSNPSAAKVRQARLESELFKNWAAARYARQYKDGAEFQNPQLVSAVAESRKHKEEKASVLAAIVHFSILRRFPGLFKFFAKFSLKKLADRAAKIYPIENFFPMKKSSKPKNLS